MLTASSALWSRYGLTIVVLRGLELFQFVYGTGRYKWFICLTFTLIHRTKELICQISCSVAYVYKFLQTFKCHLLSSFQTIWYAASKFKKLNVKGNRILTKLVFVDDSFNKNTTNLLVKVLLFAYSLESLANSCNSLDLTSSYLNLKGLLI